MWAFSGQTSLQKSYLLKSPGQRKRINDDINVFPPRSYKGMLKYVKKVKFAPCKTAASLKRLSYPKGTQNCGLLKTYDFAQRVKII